jgi:hypothetical protein
MSRTRLAPLLPACALVAAVLAISAAPANAERITGTFTYGDRDPAAPEAEPTPRPIVSARAEIFRCTPVGGVCWGWSKVRETRTDARGSIDESFAFEGRAEYAVKVFAENDAVSVWPLNAMPHLHPFHDEPRQPDGTPVHLVADSAADVLRFDFDFADDWASRHYNVADVLRHVKAFVDARRDPGETDELSRVSVEDWPGISFYLGSTIHLNADEAYEDLNILHEYGHHVEATLSNFPAIPTFHDGCEFRLPVLYSLINDPDLAWMEGFADWFAAAVMAHTPDGDFRSGPRRGTPLPSMLESEPTGCEGLPASITGDAIENRVAGALWDASDSPDGPGSRPESWDTLVHAADVLQIVDRELDGDDAPDIHDFRAAWMGRGLPGAALGRLFEHLGIPFRDNFPPIANAGADRTVDEGSRVVLYGTQSEDPELEPLSFRWQQTDADGPAVTLADARTATPSFTAPPAGAADSTMTFELVVSDGTHERSDTVTIHVSDATPPALTVPERVTVDATSPSGAPVTYAVSATDNVDPAPSVECTPASGGTFAIGTSTVVCVATDASGNRSEASFEVVVRGPGEQIGDAIASIGAIDAPSGIARSLTAKLEQAMALVASGGPNAIAAACAQVDAVIQQVNAQSGTAITADDADRLLADLRRIEAALGCAA